MAVTMLGVLIHSECVSAAIKVRWGTCYGIFFRHTILRALPAVELLLGVLLCITDAASTQAPTHKTSLTTRRPEPVVHIDGTLFRSQHSWVTHIEYTLYAT
ncbi:hypothetical protein Hypma_013291 [Hypsizygus marmoreus]|uniref:Uncharacterized protein n=1 Tax=Hypsizygus marmoreus TaxID=39966 RepID=A0A369JGF3_HYPMA|nr:hypothetical protein Hypma_013291 [Hypsizygus marmoreus]